MVTIRETAVKELETLNKQLNKFVNKAVLIVGSIFIFTITCTCLAGNFISNEDLGAAVILWMVIIAAIIFIPTAIYIFWKIRGIKILINTQEIRMKSIEEKFGEFTQNLDTRVKEMLTDNLFLELQFCMLKIILDTIEEAPIDKVPILNKFKSTYRDLLASYQKLSNFYQAFKLGESSRSKRDELKDILMEIENLYLYEISRSKPSSPFYSFLLHSHGIIFSESIKNMAESFVCFLRDAGMPEDGAKKLWKEIESDFHKDYPKEAKKRLPKWERPNREERKTGTRDDLGLEFFFVGCDLS
ncbi:hypothetical protein ACFLZS_01675 [Patescibacteria group bacterium]